MFQRNWFQLTFSLYIFRRTRFKRTFLFKAHWFLYCPKETISTHMFFLHFPQGLILKAHLLYYIFFKRSDFNTHLLSTLFQRNWYSTYIFFLRFPRLSMFKAHSFQYVSKEMISTHIFFLKEFDFNAHLLSTCSKGIDSQSTVFL